MRLRVSEVRRRFEAILEETGFTRSRFVPEQFGADTSLLLSGAFAVGVGATVLEEFDDRLRYGDEGEARTVIDVRLAYQLRADAQIQDYDRALDQEQRALIACMDLDRTGFHVEVGGMPIRFVPRTGDWLLTTIRFEAIHRIAFVGA